MDKEEQEYRRSVRNTSIIIGMMIAVIALSLIIPPLINHTGIVYGGKAKAESPYGFDLYLKINKGEINKGSNVTISTWIINSANRINNVSALSNWPISGVYSSCYPIAVAIMEGYYDQNNITHGKVLNIGLHESCNKNTPRYYILEPGSSNGIVSFDSGASRINLNYTLSVSGYFVGTSFRNFAGVYTVVAVDEWGDMAILYFHTLA
jgi:hypothetical protein